MPESDSEFEIRKERDIAAMASDKEFRASSQAWLSHSIRHRYSYNFRWLGLPIIQYPADIIALQELIWSIRPQVIVETGVARGGSLVFHASMLALLGSEGIVVGVEIALDPENRTAIERHPLAARIHLVDGSSVMETTVAKVRGLVGTNAPVMVILDSNHTHDHVLQELRAYAPLVAAGSYIVVLDTVVEGLGPESVGERPWGPGNNPKTAVHAFLRENDRFEIDRSFDDRLLLSVCPEGFLRCVRN